MPKPKSSSPGPTESGIFRHHLGVLIRGEREGRGFTQETVAEQIQISPREYQRWEAGEVDIKPARLERLRRFFDCCITALWPGRGREK